MLKAWRKDLAEQMGRLKDMNLSNKNSLVYPEHLVRLKGLEQSLRDISKTYDLTIKLGRNLASEEDSTGAFKESLKNFKREIKSLKQNQ